MSMSSTFSLSFVAVAAALTLSSVAHAGPRSSGVRPNAPRKVTITTQRFDPPSSSRGTAILPIGNLGRRGVGAAHALARRTSPYLGDHNVITTRDGWSVSANASDRTTIVTNRDGRGVLRRYTFAPARVDLTPGRTFDRAVVESGVGGLQLVRFEHTGTGAVTTHAGVAELRAVFGQ